MGSWDKGPPASKPVYSQPWPSCQQQNFSLSSPAASHPNKARQPHSHLNMPTAPPRLVSCWLQGGSGLGFLQRDSASSLTPGGGSAPSLSEAERLAAAKSTKELLAKGITLFNTKGPLKGIESLISNGLLESSPAAVGTQRMLVDVGLTPHDPGFRSDCTGQPSVALRTIIVLGWIARMA